MKTFRITNIPASIQGYHALAVNRKADAVMAGPTRTLVRFKVTQQEREMWALMDKVDTIWLIYDNASPIQAELVIDEEELPCLL